MLLLLLHAKLDSMVISSSSFLRVFPRFRYARRGSSPGVDCFGFYACMGSLGLAVSFSDEAGEGCTTDVCFGA